MFASRFHCCIGSRSLIVHNNFVPFLNINAARSGASDSENNNFGCWSWIAVVPMWGIYNTAEYS